MKKTETTMTHPGYQNYSQGDFESLRIYGIEVRIYISVSIKNATLR